MAAVTMRLSEIDHKSLKTILLGINVNTYLNNFKNIFIFKTRESKIYSIYFIMNECVEKDKLVVSNCFITYINLLFFLQDASHTRV